VKTSPNIRQAGRPSRVPRVKQRNPSHASRGSVAPVVFKRILVPVDFSAGSDCALRHAASLARAHQARVLPLHVTPPICFTVDCGYGPVNRAVPDGDSLRETRVRLQRLVHRIVPVKLAEEVRVCSGDPIEQILVAAKDWRADLIVMLAHVPLGSDLTPLTHTVDRLVREVHCPVLALHAPSACRKGRASNRLGKS